MRENFLSKMKTLLENGYKIIRTSFISCNEVVDTGAYEGDSMLDAPELGRIRLIVTRYTANWIVQECMTDSLSIFLRSYNFGHWSRWQEINEEDDKECLAEHLRLDKRIDKLALESNERYYSLLQEITKLKNKTITGHDVVVEVDGGQLSLQAAINKKLFCECEEPEPPVCISAHIGGFIIGSTFIGKVCGVIPESSDALCGTFKSYELKCGEGL